VAIHQCTLGFPRLKTAKAQNAGISLRDDRDVFKQTTGRQHLSSNHAGPDYRIPFPKDILETEGNAVVKPTSSNLPGLEQAQADSSVIDTDIRCRFFQQLPVSQRIRPQLPLLENL
jgi:hypothetical protein